jgi:hypothetical protein
MAHSFLQILLKQKNKNIVNHSESFDHDNIFTHNL